MSSSQFAASLTTPVMGAQGTASPSSILWFNVAKTQTGSIIDRTMIELEELVTPGVDGKRWRQVRTYFAPFRMETWADFATYGVAINECRYYWMAQGQFATLSWTAGGYSAQWFLVKILDVQAKASAGVMCGYGAQPSSNAIIHAVWTLNVQAIENAQPT